ncbi:hypothetical protein [Sphingobacterium faecale]|uniref:Ig-like domain-containing protein n=1 Tax=Sphingobacterium faecale TaxID=2803775 RepID=A0ABS1R8K3_9SPHI|nr:hypothetical protein [Sphingobacterium faecale]MBL1411013.1 hypothetical protein [Sphingobacterium faecale]
MLNQLYKLTFLFIIVLNTGSHTARASNRMVAVEDSVENAFQFVKRLLPAGEYQADVLGASMMDPKQQELMKKMKMAIANNIEWYQEVLRGLKPGEPMPYHEKLGMSREEYSGMLKSFESVKLDKMFSASLTVSQEGGTLTFDGGNDLPFLDHIVIDSDSKCILIQGDTLLYQNAIQMDNSRTTLQAGPWQGYSWKREVVSRAGELITDHESVDIVNDEELDMSMYNCTIGKLDNKGECFMYIKVLVLKGGEVVTKQDIALIIRASPI